MNILVVGAGGREHALAWKFIQSPKINKVYVTPGNDGIATIAECWGLTDLDQIIKRAQAEQVDLVIIGQEDYLIKGLTEKLENAGLKVFAPTQKAAQLEGSKAFAKRFMQKYQIPTADFKVFNQIEDAQNYLQQNNVQSVVIKADGLAAGKGVFICHDQKSALQALNQIMVEQAFGNSGNTVVIEEFLTGEEASYFIFTDGENYISMPSSQDHKRLQDGDQGPNTGGMGAYAPAPIVTPIIEKDILHKIIEPTLKGMKQEGMPYRGVLYVGLMINQGKSYVVEYNARFGDPECQNIMMLLDTDLTDICLAAIEGNLKNIDVQWKKQSAACIILASGGYPQTYQTGYTIHGLEDIPVNDQCVVFHAGTKKVDNHFLTNGGRVLGVTAVGTELKQALNLAYQNVTKISWEQMHYRRDIGLKGLEKYES